MNAPAAAPLTLHRLQHQQDAADFALTHPDISMLWSGERQTAKSHAQRIVKVDHHLVHGDRARTLCWRLTSAEHEEAIAETIQLLAAYFGSDARRFLNKHDQRITIPGHGSLDFYGIEDRTAALKVLGRSYSQLVFDEFSTCPPTVYSTLRTSLRSAAVPDTPTVPTRILGSTNPWGPSASGLKATYYNGRPIVYRDGQQLDDSAIFDEAPGDPISRRWVHLMPSLEQNPFADLQVLADIKAEPDPAKRLAHLYGDWEATGSGGFFDGVLTQHNLVPPWPHTRPDPRTWELSLGYDHGVANPASCLLMALALQNTHCPNGYPHAKGDVVVVDEVSTASPTDLNVAEYQYGIPALAQLILDMCIRYGFPRPRGIADAAIFAQDGRSPIADEFRHYGVYFKASTKPPLITRGPFVKNLMSRATTDYNARIGNQPALYICRGRCNYLVDSMRALERHPSNPDIWKGPDHAFDALTYRLMTKSARTFVAPLF